MDLSFTIRMPTAKVTEAGRQWAGAVLNFEPAESVTDEVLLSGISAGNREDFAELFRRYARMVRGVAYRVLKDPAEADDLLQDVFILIYRLCRTFDPSKGSARFWILQMTQRRAISRRRYLTSRHFYDRLDLPSDRLADPKGNSRMVDSMAEALQGQETMQAWMELLSEAQRETLRLFFFEGYTFEEIAARLGQTVGNARHHYYRGLDRLRKQIFAGKIARR